MKAYSLAISRIQRSPYKAIAAISILTMTLFLAGVFFVIAAGSEVILRYFETRPQVIAYFKKEVDPTPERINELKTKLTQSGLVSQVQYTSKADAYKLYTEDNKNYPLLLEGVTADILPASIEISATDPSHLKTIADTIKSEADISEVQFPEDIVAPFARWTYSIRVIGLALVGAHILISLLIIILIISVKVSTRREEIATYQLMGATGGYISAPFTVEGCIYGILSALLAWGLTYLVLLYSMPFLVTFLGTIPGILPPPVTFMLYVLGAEVALGSLIGGLGGMFAVSRFLK